MAQATTPQQIQHQRRHVWRRLGKLGVYGVLLILLLLFLFPIFWMVVASLQPNSVIVQSPPVIFGDTATIDSYVRILTTPRYITYFRNSIIVSFSTVFFTLIFGVFAGYGFSRFRFWGREGALTAVLSIQMFPRVAILIALFAFFSAWNLTNTYAGLILSNVMLTLPFSIWFLKSFFDTVPYDLEESAYIDGAGRLRTMLQIILPLIQPGLIAVAIYSFLLSWDDFLFAFTIITRDELRTVPVGIALSFIGEFEYDWTGMMALSVLASLPIVITFVFLQKYMIAGLTQGAVKN